MKDKPTSTNRIAQLRRTGAVLFAAIFSILGTHEMCAGSATWNLNPTSGDWNTAANWTPATVPDGPSDTATFAVSNQTKILLPLSTEIDVDSIVFNVDATAFTITVNPNPPLFALVIGGTGIVNNSVLSQKFTTKADATVLLNNSATVGASTLFINDGDTISDSIKFGATLFGGSSSAGNATFINNGGTASGAVGGSTQFGENSTAGNGVFITNGGTVPNARESFLYFYDNSTAANGVFTVNGGTASGAAGGYLDFFFSPTAGNGTFTINGGTANGAGGGFLIFDNTSTASNATLIANGGSSGGGGGLIYFTGDSLGGTARVELFGGGLYLFHNAPGVTIGSIEGSGGIVYLDANNLTVGSNNLSTSFTGEIQDGGNGGSFTKIGTGTLTLGGSNTYTGGTTVEEGVLLVRTGRVSALGTGPVQVNAGTFGGRGKISGAVRIDDGSDPGAFLAPGLDGPGILVIDNTLTFNSDSTYNWELNLDDGKADQVRAKRVKIKSGALFSFTGLGSGTLVPGTVFTAIRNNSGRAINGTFANLADGTTFTANGNNFQVSYEGGNGNDLTLTVVP